MNCFHTVLGVCTIVTIAQFNYIKTVKTVQFSNELPLLMFFIFTVIILTIIQNCGIIMHIFVFK